jgi:NADPH2:quinone reductase
VIGALVRDGEPVVEHELPHPVAGGAGMVVVAVEAACLSHLDLQIAAGQFAVRPREPYVPCTEGLGRIVAGDADLVGRRVRIRGEGVGMTRDGCCSELAAVPVGALHDVREDVDAVLAATFFVPCSTAAVALHDVGGVQPGELVGVRGASGAVGSIAVQMALAAGADVVAVVATPERAETLPEGARPVVAATADELRERLAGAQLDLLVDTVGGPDLEACLPAMRPRSRIVLVGYAGGARLDLDITSLLVHDVSILPVNGVSREPETAGRAHAWLDDLVGGRLFLPTSSYPLSQLGAAVTALGERPSPGRVAILL